MKIKQWMSNQGKAITISTLIVVVGFLVISQMYFTYSENRAMSNGCYDKGGLPIVEKSWLSITNFDCDMNP
ncbi:hypothetical protein M3197_09155 [Sporosarcina aquimarina]|uniref:hypothetical protein n=1 Tax=Sporosarcina aquimarina TaxID=114975 RepID=UPI00203F8E03|nr:hypothetical protein [Sporosarcina aquimarina]MCM3757656.1 hypothetical protein [Sporosarcina aquimarina]